MPKKFLAIRASDNTRAKVLSLAAQWGTTQTEVVAIAVDRLYQSDTEPVQEEETEQETWKYHPPDHTITPQGILIVPRREKGE